MRVSQRRWKAGDTQASEPVRANLVLVFGGRDQLETLSLDQLARAFPGASVVGCSTAREIGETSVTEGSVVMTALQFDHGRCQVANRFVDSPEGSLGVGESLARELTAPDLVHVFVLSDGLHVNGSALAKGLAAALPPGVRATGGLSGDGTAFGRTVVLHGDTLSERRVVAVGFYGKRLQVGFGSVGGWDPFGPDRRVTRSEGNVVFELDGQSALGLYKTYLGAHAAGLPASGLRFPLSVHSPESRYPVVRTILAIDEVRQSLTFAGDIPEGSFARLMKANADRLVDGAHQAAELTLPMTGSRAPEVALLVSCVGRRLVLNQRVDEEIETVREVVGPQTTLAGFYSYGEICPSAADAACQLHNQTMTITTFAET